ncbi:hypothetical protein DERP_001572 [Dermatophagoides pteronyssinus]|uniref:Uncharacterized protein n=1 Tax=Dermatophagoides pteronyssinus TaxID=6956 RepID=A0ABQ8JBM1_DERPT|nr:hypothetical protein DERP_001572 [Dermatophagoides pteronyssinus]
MKINKKFHWIKQIILLISNKENELIENIIEMEIHRNSFNGLANKTYLCITKTKCKSATKSNTGYFLALILPKKSIFDINDDDDDD